MLRRATAKITPLELGVLPQFKGPQPLQSLSHAFKFAAPVVPSDNPKSAQSVLSELASQYLLIESGRIPLWDKSNAMNSLKTRVQDLFEESLNINRNDNKVIPLSALFKFYVTRFHNDAFPYRIMQRHYLEYGQLEQAAEMDKLAIDKISCNRSRFHAIASCINNSDSAACSLAKYSANGDKNDHHLMLIIQKADKELDSKTVIDAFCLISNQSVVPIGIFSRVLLNVKRLVPTTFSPPLLVPIKRVYPILSKHFDELQDASISQEMYRAMASVQCSVGDEDALVKLYARAECIFPKSEKTRSAFANAFLRLNMYNALENLLSSHNVKFSISEHVKYAALLAEVLSPEQLLSKLGGLRLSAPVVSAALLTYSYTRAGRHDDPGLINAISAVQQNYGNLARHRPSAVMYVAACAERSLLPTPFAVSASEELATLASRPAFLSNQKLRRIVLSIRAWTAARKGNLSEAESFVMKALALQKDSPESMRGAIIRASAIAAIVAMYAIKGDLERIEALSLEMKKLKCTPTASIMYSKLFAAAVAGNKELFQMYHESIQRQLQLETVSPHIVPTLVDLYDSIRFDDSRLLRPLFTPELLCRIDSRFVTKLQELPLFLI